MKLSVCLVCLKTFDGEDLTSEEDGTPCGVPLLTSLSQLEGFRTSLAQKCHRKRKQALPNLLLTSQSQCGEVQTCMMELENDESLFHHNLESQKVEIDPLALEAANNDNALEDNLSSIERQNSEEEAPGRILIGSVMKVETLHQDSSPEPLFKNANDDDIEDSPSELRELEEIPVAERAKTRIKGILYNGYRCPTCSKVLNSESQYHIHYRYHHQHVSCTACGKAFRGNKLLHIHVTRLHQQQGVFTCNMCSKVFNTAYRLDNHLSRMHPSKEQMNHCLQCEVSFRMEHNLKQHVDTIHSPEIYPCPHCPTGAQRFSTSKYLSTHIKLRHPADGRQS
ncbi:unnamed protein product [Orchesella dallaii]|uniref:C2H2-type domain-containing protein n=1 Tax=Orchesella dallaii TaxID=48710 RepID=A0ABP1SB15_9HEXA